MFTPCHSFEKKKTVEKKEKINKGKKEMRNENKSVGMVMTVA